MVVFQDGLAPALAGNGSLMSFDPARSCDRRIGSSGVCGGAASLILAGWPVKVPVSTRGFGVGVSGMVMIFTSVESFNGDLSIRVKINECMGK